MLFLRKRRKCFIYRYTTDIITSCIILHFQISSRFQGNQFFKEGKYEAAINRYTIAINLHPTNPIFYANRGMALLKMER